jgi:cobalt-zinc-cadmium efflux system membrane fusion protein
MTRKFSIGKFLFFALPVTFVSFAMQSCNSNENKGIGDRQQYQIPDSLLKTLTIDTVQNCQLVNSITLNAQVDFNQDNEVNIYPLVSGNIEDVKVQLGDYVTAGQVLAVVKSSEMAGYGNTLINAETSLTVAKKNLAAEEDLFKSGLASQLDVTTAQANYDQAVAQLDMIKKVLKINGDNTQGNYIIKAPISGFIVQKNITNNTTIRTDNGNNLFTISDLKNVWVWANVYESNINLVHLGDEVDVTTLSYPGKIFKGKVDKILNVLDPTNKVMKIRVALPNPDYLLKPQMFASVRVSSQGNQDALCIPTSAIRFDHSQYFVLLYNSPSNVRITPVQVINTIGNKTYISGGIKSGDCLIATDVLQIYDELNN